MKWRRDGCFLLQEVPYIFCTWKGKINRHSSLFPRIIYNRDSMHQRVICHKKNGEWRKKSVFPNMLHLKCKQALHEENAKIFTFCVWRYTRLSTTGTNDAAATALTSSSRSWSPSIILVKTLGNKVLITSCKRVDQNRLIFYSTIIVLKHLLLNLHMEAQIPIFILKESRKWKRKITSTDAYVTNLISKRT